MELTLHFLEDFVNNYLNPYYHEALEHSLCQLPDFFHCLPQIQSLVAIVMAKLYTQAFLSELFDESNKKHLSFYLSFIQHAASIIGDVAYYMIVYHGHKLRPGFKSFIHTKLSESITLFL